MQKRNKILMGTISALLCLVLISSCCLSGIYAKFVKSSSAEATILLKKWGIEVDTGTDIASSYTADNGKVVVSSTVTMGANEGLMAPGTGGYLAYFRITGNPEFNYKIDFNGAISIGDGFKSSSRLIRDENGDAIEYFPIQLRYVAYDVLSNGDLTEVTSLTSDQFCVQRTDKQDNQHYFNDGALENIAELTTVMNSSTDMGINNALDELYKAPNTSIDRIYAIEWKWLYHYDTTEEVAAGKTENNRETTAKGNYQTRELDTTLGEAITKNPELFNITLNMGVTVEQLNGAATTYKLFYENGVRKIEFGSYPQTDVTATKGEALNELVGTNYSSWDDYKYTSGNMRYIDVTLDGEKYRGVYFTEVRNDEQAVNNYNTKSIYWFKYEPIVWTILDRNVESGEVLILSDMIIDSQPYQSGEVPSGLYKNNYEYSTIRTWLNETFYNTAFNDLQKQVIITTEVVNDAESADLSDNTYVCANTNDNVFLLSVAECENYFKRSSNRFKAPTDYAFSQGSWKATESFTPKFPQYWGNGYWWLRSPSAKGNEYAAVVMHSGVINNDEVLLFEDGVVPALWIKL